jgi:hypothetical protein
MVRALEEVGRDPAGFTFAAQVRCGETPADRRAALETARAFVELGAQHVILGMTPSRGPDDLRLIAREVAEPLMQVATSVARA